MKIAPTTHIKDKNACKELSALVVKGFFDGDYSNAISPLKSHWPLPEEELEYLQQTTNSQMEQVQERFGKVLAYKKVEEAEFQDFLYRILYIIQFENHAIRLKFIYYYNSKGWLLNNFTWDDELSEWFT